MADPDPQLTAGPLISFEPSLPVDTERLRHNVTHALSLGLREAAPARAAPGRIGLVANGPSASLAPLTGTRPIAALNGALSLFAAAGVAPAYHVLCDPQPAVLSFLRDRPVDTTYCVASRCDPAVFAALADRDVLLWHLAEQETLELLATRTLVEAGVSVTLASLCLFHILGWRRFDVWGLDLCLDEHGRSHAGAGGIDARLLQPIRVGERLFQSSPGWALEAQQFVLQMHHLAADVTIHGDGLLSAILAEMARGASTG